MMAWRSCVSSLGPFIGPCSRLVPPSYVLIVYSCHSKQAAAFLIYPVSPTCLVPRPVEASAPLPSLSHSLRSSVSSIVPPCVSFIRLVIMSSRLSSRSSSRPVLPDVPNGLPPVLRSRRFVQLISPFSSPCLRPRLLMTG